MSFTKLYKPTYDLVATISDKPMMIAEFGCTEQGTLPGTSKADWITNAYMHAIPAQFSRFKLVNWFDRDKSKEGEFDWRFNSSPAALAAYKAAVNSPEYRGKLDLPDHNPHD